MLEKMISIWAKTFMPVLETQSKSNTTYLLMIIVTLLIFFIKDTYINIK